MAELRISGLVKSFGDVRALDDVSIVADEGGLLTLLGPSGCGKSTTLWSVAGLHTPDGGTITIGDRTVFDGDRRLDLPPEDRACGVVFQSYAIWPHLSVADNVGYPLKVRRVARAERRRRVGEMLDLVELGHLAGRYPHELSGGQQQRVALARALAHRPRLLLLDEPFSNFDAKLRERARTWLRDLQQQLRITTVFVTHDQGEALSMSDRIVVMHDGRVAQVGTPEEVYREPADGFVADFVGSINLLPGQVIGLDGDTARFLIDGSTRPVTVRVDGPVPAGRGTLGVRPEAIDIVTGEDPADDPDRSEPAGTVQGTATTRRFLGDHYRHLVTVGAVELTVQTNRAEIPAHPVLRFPDRCRIFEPVPHLDPDPGVNAAGPTRAAGPGPEPDPYRQPVLVPDPSSEENP